jgi:hypothetical protein
MRMRRVRARALIRRVTPSREWRQERPRSAADQLDYKRGMSPSPPFHCASSNEVVVYRLTAPDRATLEFSVPLPRGKCLFARHVYPDVPARTFMMSADRSGLFVTGGDGAIGEVNLALGRFQETPVSGDQNEIVAHFASPGAFEGGRMYVGVGPYDGQGVAQEIRVFDTSTWALVGTIRT